MASETSFHPISNTALVMEAIRRFRGRPIPRFPDVFEAAPTGKVFDWLLAVMSPDALRDGLNILLHQEQIVMTGRELRRAGSGSSTFIRGAIMQLHPEIPMQTTVRASLHGQFLGRRQLDWGKGFYLLNLEKLYIADGSRKDRGLPKSVHRLMRTSLSATWQGL
jgi:hypothetical protein